MQFCNSLYNTSIILLKELEHRKLGWKVFIFKYDLGKSLSKEMWCKMADAKTNFDFILKNMKNACIFRSVLVCAHFSSKLPHAQTVFWWL